MLGASTALWSSSFHLLITLLDRSIVLMMVQSRAGAWCRDTWKNSNRETGKFMIKSHNTPWSPDPVLKYVDKLCPPVSCHSPSTVELVEVIGIYCQIVIQSLLNYMHAAFLRAVNTYEMLSPQRTIQYNTISVFSSLYALAIKQTVTLGALRGALSSPAEGTAESSAPSAMFFKPSSFYRW